MKPTTAHEIDLPPLAAQPSPDGKSAGIALGFLDKLKVKVTVRLGETEANVGHLLEMKPGEVLDLDRRIDQPVDVLVDGFVVARGTLVAVGDHFGVRLTDAPTLQGLPAGR
jgi:flagellar motor switch protein FliN/FliY